MGTLEKPNVNLNLNHKDWKEIQAEKRFQKGLTFILKYGFPVFLILLGLLIKNMGGNTQGIILIPIGVIYLAIVLAFDIRKRALPSKQQRRYRKRRRRR